MAAVGQKFVETTQLLSRFRGSLVGAVVGDCLGQHYEGSFAINLPKLLQFFAGVKEDGASKLARQTRAEWHEFTDDTAMARSVAQSIIENKGLNVRDMARRFVSEYYNEPDRGYGGNVITVFEKLRGMDCLDPHGPAKEQFDGRGSYGNGAAMRIAPASLYIAGLPPSESNSIVSDISKITHANRDAINGAILESTAIRLALKEDSSKPLDVANFIDQLCQHMREVETEKTPASKSKSEEEKALPCDEVKCSTPYCDKLEKMKTFLNEGSVSRNLIVAELGNNISAIGSVPAAVYSFLRCTQPVHDIKVENAFERTIIYAISLCGDTDTIATMAGAIAGAYYGMEKVPSEWAAVCEGVTDAVQQADALYHLSSISPDES